MDVPLFGSTASFFLPLAVTPAIPLLWEIDDDLHLTRDVYALHPYMFWIPALFARFTRL